VVINFEIFFAAYQKSKFALKVGLFLAAYQKSTFALISMHTRKVFQQKNLKPTFMLQQTFDLIELFWKHF
jgi:hypothetical protein